MVAFQLGTGLVCTAVKRDTHLPDMVIDKGRMAHARLARYYKKAGNLKILKIACV